MPNDRLYGPLSHGWRTGRHDQGARGVLARVTSVWTATPNSGELDYFWIGHTEFRGRARSRSSR
eukprot:15462047-Alexandrium_andersonii.AAC.1